MDMDSNYLNIPGYEDRFVKYHLSSLNGNPTDVGWYFATISHRLTLLRWWDGKDWSFPASMFCTRMSAIEGAVKIKAPRNEAMFWLPLDAGLPSDEIMEVTLLSTGYSPTSLKTYIKELKKHFNAFMKAR